MRNTDHAALLRSLPELYEGHTLDTLPGHLLGFLSRIIPADLTAYNEVDLRNGRMVVVLEPPESGVFRLLEALETHIRQHPVVQHEQRTGDISARKISDFLSKAEYHRLPLYHEVYRSLGAEDQFALALHLAPRTIVALALNRSRRNFTERDRALLNLLQPHFVQAYRNAETLTRLRRQLSGVQGRMETLPLGLAWLDPRLRITFSTEQARTAIQRYFAEPASASNGSLPAGLRAWILRTRKWQNRALPNGTDTYSVDGPTGTLSIRCVREQGRDETLLVFEERRQAGTLENLRALGLTRREAEILLWVARGKSNPEIAIILNTATRTVQKHLEHVFIKLGVATRTDAARRALESFSPDLRSV